ncbi:hypothetical protein N8865_03180 [Francisellaceae bacterium]|nr:hypothetical protein [Francisellaceae bacterium]
MLNQISSTDEKQNAWIEVKKTLHSNTIFGKIVGALLWTNESGEDGKPLINIDPEELVTNINQNPWPLLEGHDPGKIVGQVLEAKLFEHENTNKSIVGILGYYNCDRVLDFKALDLGEQISVSSPQLLPALPEDFHIKLQTDPREIDQEWFEISEQNSLLEFEYNEASYNALDSMQQLITVGVPYVCFVWNPFVTSIAKEAGKDTYIAVKAWIKSLVKKAQSLRNPIISFKSRQRDCEVTFIYRGKNINKHYLALESHHIAALQAAKLIDNLIQREMPAKEIIYEYDAEGDKWFPLHAVLTDNRLIKSEKELIPYEILPTNLSLGLDGNLLKETQSL